MSKEIYRIIIIFRYYIMGRFRKSRGGLKGGSTLEKLNDELKSVQDAMRNIEMSNSGGDSDEDVWNIHRYGEEEEAILNQIEKLKNKLPGGARRRKRTRRRRKTKRSGGRKRKSRAKRRRSRR